MRYPRGYRVIRENVKSLAIVDVSCCCSFNYVKWGWGEIHPFGCTTFTVEAKRSLWVTIKDPASSSSLLSLCLSPREQQLYWTSTPTTTSNNNFNNFTTFARSQCPRMMHLIFFLLFDMHFQTMKFFGCAQRVSTTIVTSLLYLVVG